MSEDRCSISPFAVMAALMLAALVFSISRPCKQQATEEQNSTKESKDDGTSIIPLGGGSILIL